MYSPALRGGLAFLRGLAVAAIVFFSVTVLLPCFSRTGGAAQPEFSRPNIRVDTASQLVESSNAGGPSITVDASGTLHTVWSNTFIPPDKGIYYAKSLDRGATWTMEVRLDTSPGQANIAPSIAVDVTGGIRDGNIYVVWQRGETSNAESVFIESLDGGATWVNQFVMDMAPSGSVGMYPKVAVDSDGAVYIAYMSGSTGGYSIQYATSADGGANWAFGSILLASVNFQGYQAIAAGGGLVGIAWEESSALSDTLWISVSIDKGVTWIKNPIVSFGSGMQDASWVSISIGDDNEIHAAWIATNEFGSSSVAYSRSSDNGATWIVPVTVSDAPSSITYTAHSATVLAFSGSLYVVWSDNRNGDYDIFCSWSADDGATWGDAIPSNDVRVDDTDDNALSGDDATLQTASSAAMDQDGIYAIWSDGRQPLMFNVYFSMFDLTNVMITEVRDGPDGLEQIEIYNAVSEYVDMAGLVLEVNGVLMSLSPLGSVGPKTYWTIGDPSLSSMPHDINLGDEGGIIRLLDITGTEIDMVAYGQLGPVPDPIEGESVARVPSGTSYRQSWARAQIPTFGSANNVRAPDQSSGLVLNEVYFNAANPNDRFIELHLNGIRPLDTGGFIVAGDSVHALPSVWLTDTDREFAFRPSDDPTLFSLMDASGDNLYLYDPGGAFIDMVGWSSPHAQGSSMARMPDGAGDPSGYDDASSIVAGWVFDRYPSLPLVSVGPDQTGYANPGDVIYYALTAKNKEPTAAYVNVEAFAGGEGWRATLLKDDSITPLPDSPGDPDDTPDLGLLASGESKLFVVSITVPIVSPGNESQTSNVLVSIASDPMARSMASLKTILFPYESPTADVDPSTIWVSSAPPSCQPKEATVELTISGRGTPVYGGNPQDTIFVMDSSGSMTSNDPFRLRLAAAKRYVDLMQIPDRAAVVKFEATATLVNGDHLSSDYAQIKQNIERISNGGNTNIYDAIRISTDELIWRGDDSHLWIQILLTDGQDTTGHTYDMILGEARRAADNGIMIFTIGLGDFADEVLLQEIAAVANGLYLKAETANDLDQIYQLIGNVTKAIAGYDEDITDDIPMINIFLPSDMNYVPGSATPPPAYIGTYMGLANLQWNVSQLKVGETWTAAFGIVSDFAGYGQRAIYYPLSRVTYLRHDDLRVNIPFPVTLIDVLAAPILPDLSVSPSDIALSPPSPYIEGDAVSIAATIHNIGQAYSGETTVTFHDGLLGPQIGAGQALHQIGPGLTQDVFIDWTAAGPGSHEICANADPGSRVAEESETNNIACVSIYVSPLTPKKPDYVPYMPEPPAPRKVGLSADLRLSLMVANLGNASAGASSTIALSNITGPPFAVTVIPPIPESGTSSRFQTTWRAPSAPGIYRVHARVDYLDDVEEWDEANNEYVWTFEVVPAPVTSLEVGKPRHESASSFITSATPVDFSVEDLGGTGISLTEYRIDGGGWVNYTEKGRFNVHGEGEHILEWYSADRAGNVEQISSAMLVVDDTPPVTTMIVGEPRYVSGTCFVTSRTPLSLQAEDGGAMPVGLGGISFRTWDGAWGQWSPFVSQFTLEGPDGVRRIEFKASDLLENTEPTAGITLVVDNTAPAMMLDPEGSRFIVGTSFSLGADDGGGSGVNFLWLSVDGESPSTYAGTFSLHRGMHLIVYLSADNLGNAAQLERTVELVAEDAGSIIVSFNYKPTIAFLFSLLLLGAAALSARKRLLRRCKVPWRRFLASWALLSLPFISAEAVTGFISVYLEPMRIPPLIGWGMAVDVLILGVGMSVLLGRFVLRKDGGRGRMSGTDAPEPPDID